MSITWKELLEMVQDNSVSVEELEEKIDEYFDSVTIEEFIEDTKEISLSKMKNSIRR